jgi:hypothetical protein
LNYQYFLRASSWKPLKLEGVNPDISAQVGVPFQTGSDIAEVALAAAESVSQALSKGSTRSLDLPERDTSWDTFAAAHPVYTQPMAWLR